MKKSTKEQITAILQDCVDRAIKRVKKDMLLLKAHNPNLETYFGIYYNPGGPDRIDYNWSVPTKIFNMKQDKCVLIGPEYWDFVGG